MKRKQAFAFNAAGPTCNYISMQGRNALQNGGYPMPISPNNGINVYSGIDYTYRQIESFRKKFLGVYWDFISGGDNSDDIFKFHPHGYESTEQLWFMFGWRVIIEFFDVNAMLYLDREFDEGTPIDCAAAGIAKVLSPFFRVQRLSNQLINIEL